MTVFEEPNVSLIHVTAIRELAVNQKENVPARMQGTLRPNINIRLFPLTQFLIRAQVGQ